MWGISMDITNLTALILPYLMRCLPIMIESGNFVGGKALEKLIENTTDEVWTAVRPWLEKLIGKFESNPSAIKAIQSIAAAPERKDLQIALKVELEDILAENQILAEEIVRILGCAETSNKQIIADHGGVAFGDNAQGNLTITNG